MTDPVFLRFIDIAESCGLNEKQADECGEDCVQIILNNYDEMTNKYDENEIIRIMTEDYKFDFLKDKRDEVSELIKEEIKIYRHDMGYED